MRAQDSVQWRRWCLTLAAVSLAGCATVDLGGGYSPPPIQQPQQPAAPQPQMPPPGVQTHPVPPTDQLQPTAPAPVPQANLVALTSQLEGRNVVPPVSTRASGQVDAVYDRDTGLLRWKASWNDLSSPIIGIQFRGPAGNGQNAAAVMTWPGPFGPRYEGRATLNQRQADDLLRGLWYLSVATSNYPGGELRGQMRVVN